MKKIIKNICLFSIMFCLSLMFIDNVQAAGCNVLGINSCNGSKDDQGYECGWFNGSCQPKSCAAYTTNKNYGNCPTDRCTTEKIEGVCLPIQGVKGYPLGALTCEDYGKLGVVGTYNFAQDDLGNMCAQNEEGFNYTYEEMWESSGSKWCTDYDKENCPDHDDIPNKCEWDGKICNFKTNQVKINQTGQSAIAVGKDFQEEVEKTKTQEILKKIIKPNPSVIKSKSEFKCSDVKYLTSAWTFLRIASPFIIVLFGSLDFFKSMVAGDEKKMKESRGKFIKRLIAFGLLILLPFVVQFIFQNMGTYGSDNVCLIKCITTNDTSEKGCD